MRSCDLALPDVSGPWDIWRRLPPKQRKQIANVARKHGPKVASRLLKASARARSRRAK